MYDMPDGRIANPRVTVLLPCHRADEYLRVAIESILQQTLTDFELLILLDKRLWGQEAEVLRFTKSDPRAVLVPSLAVGGLAAGLNLGISRARGEYLARMDGDDISLPQRLAAQVEFLDRHPDIVAVGSRLRLIDEHGRELSQAYPFYQTDREIRAVLPLRNPMPHPALMFRKSVLFELGGYKYAHSAEDWELFIRMARVKGNGLHNLDQTLVQYRRHASQITRPELTGAVFYETAAFLFSEWLRTGSLKYLFAIGIKLPFVVRTRLALRSWKGRLRAEVTGKETGGQAGCLP